MSRNCLNCNKPINEKPINYKFCELSCKSQFEKKNIQNVKDVGNKKPIETLNLPPLPAKYLVQKFEVETEQFSKMVFEIEKLNDKKNIIEDNIEYLSKEIEKFSGASSGNTMMIIGGLIGGTLVAINLVKKPKPTESMEVYKDPITGKVKIVTVKKEVKKDMGQTFLESLLLAGLGLGAGMTVKENQKSHLEKLKIQKAEFQNEFNKINFTIKIKKQELDIINRYETQTSEILNPEYEKVKAERDRKKKEWEDRNLGFSTE